MPADADRSGGADRGVSEPEVRTPRRSAEEVVRDLEQERAGLVEAVDRLKVEARATKARLLSPRTLAIAGGVVVLLIALRRWRKKR
jgi:hypothetical protein